VKGPFDRCDEVLGEVDRVFFETMDRDIDADARVSYGYQVLEIDEYIYPKMPSFTYKKALILTEAPMFMSDLADSIGAPYDG
jgi:hypothetical protein